jgi:hypothetical protein
VKKLAEVSRSKPGATPKGRERISVFENLVKPISPGNFPIKVLDWEFNPIQDLELSVEFTSGPKITKKTDGEGVAMIPRKEEIKVSTS